MSDVAVVAVPQWQGSPTPHARSLREGAIALAELVPASRRLVVDTAADAGPARDGVRALDSLIHNLDLTRQALAEVRGMFPVTLGGDCAVDLAPIEAAIEAHGDRVTVVWFDAHGDLNTPASSPSGAFHGMVLRTLLGSGPAELVPHRPLRPTQVVLAGTRSLDPGEHAFIERTGIRCVGVQELATPDPLVQAVTDTGATAVHIHVDLDVLDPEIFDAVGTPEPNGLAPHELVHGVRALAARFSLTGLTVTEYEKNEEEVPPVVSQLLEELLLARIHR
ncbi:arginase family protein [Streptomyces glaucosporus]|uniref:Arginase family protein n=1 Tax=Streptomyces glaucosporus TaxID=284044 RepID=A0ABP5W4G4_9ACTN